MEIKVNFLDNLKVEAKFDDFSVVADQPIRYKGDGAAPGPFDYFLASSALCAAYFVRVYCNSRDIPTEISKYSKFRSNSLKVFLKNIAWALFVQLIVVRLKK
jgi:uncharacterized OsmC-like protein